MQPFEENCIFTAISLRLETHRISQKAHKPLIDIDKTMIHILLHSYMKIPETSL